MNVLNCFRPNTGVSSFDEEKSDLMQKYRKISLDEAGKFSVSHSVYQLGINLGISFLRLESEIYSRDKFSEYQNTIYSLRISTFSVLRLIILRIAG